MTLNIVFNPEPNLSLEYQRQLKNALDKVNSFKISFPIYSGGQREFRYRKIII